MFKDWSGNYERTHGFDWYYKKIYSSETEEQLKNRSVLLNCKGLELGVNLLF